MADYSTANRKIAYTLGRGRACISDMSSTSGYMGVKYFQDFVPRFFVVLASGYMGVKYFQEFGPRFFDMSSASGYMGAKYVQELAPDFWRVMFQMMRVMACQYLSCR